MTNNHSTQNSHQARSIVRRTGGLISVVVLGGLLLASCSADLTDLGATATALGGAEVTTAATPPLQHQRFDHSVVNQRSTVYESDLPGASIAAYGN